MICKLNLLNDNSKINDLITASDSYRIFTKDFMVSVKRNLKNGLPVVTKIEPITPDEQKSIDAAFEDGNSDLQAYFSIRGTDLCRFIGDVLDLREYKETKRKYFKSLFIQIGKATIHAATFIGSGIYFFVVVLDNPVNSKTAGQFFSYRGIIEMVDDIPFHLDKHYNDKHGKTGISGVLRHVLLRHLSTRQRQEEHSV